MQLLKHKKRRKPEEANEGEDMEEISSLKTKREPVELTPKQEKIRDGTMLAFNIHASVAGSIIGMLMAINLLVMITSKNRSLWSLFILFAWGGVLGIHFGVTWSIFLANKIPTDDLKDFILVIQEGYDTYVQPLIQKIQEGGNPFRKRSRAYKIYNYLLKP